MCLQSSLQREGGEIRGKGFVSVYATYSVECSITDIIVLTPFRLTEEMASQNPLLPSSKRSKRTIFFPGVVDTTEQIGNHI